MNRNATGYIRVRVTNSGGNFPVEGATVTITDYNEGGGGAVNGDPVEGALLYTLRTDASGQTRTVPVPTVPSAESLAPGVKVPYALYNIRVTKENYYTAESIGIPVFEGVVSLQPFLLQPLSETDLAGGVGDRIVYEIVDAPGLQGMGYPDEATGGQLTETPDLTEAGGAENE